MPHFSPLAHTIEGGFRHCQAKNGHGAQTYPFNDSQLQTLGRRAQAKLSCPADKLLFRNQNWSWKITTKLVKTINYRKHLMLKCGSRPLSRVLSWTVIPLGRLSPDASSNQPGSDAGRIMAPLFGLAPGGVCPATPVARGAVRSYRTISTLPDPVARPSAVCFLWHFPSARAVQALPGTLPCGARTFLYACAQRLSGRLPLPLYLWK